MTKRAEWETICKYETNSGCRVTQRLKIFDGWLVSDCHLFIADMENKTTSSMVFVPDPEHKWEVE